LKESDAIALFPGGFGTQDEAFECITLGQTGKTVPVPMVLIDKPGGSYWHDWSAYIEKQLLNNGLISPGDRSLYTVTDRLDVAVNQISSFYQVYHSNRYVGEQLVIRLRCQLSEAAIAELNERFSDILVKGQIRSSLALPEEAGDETFELPRLVLHFNQRDLGRLFEMIRAINQLGCPPAELQQHPERK
ncbi:LOG family protein, partial [filamentous cyanobacterium LEGE 11480]